MLAAEREEFSAPYTTDEQSLNSASSLVSDVMQETTQNQRFTRPHNAVFKYDFKVGNYMPDDVKKMNPHMFNTMKDITTGIRKSSWFTSLDYTRMLKSNIASHLLYFNNLSSFSPNNSSLVAKNSELDSTFVLNSYHSTNVTFTGAFYNFFMLLSAPSNLVMTR